MRKIIIYLLLVIQIEFSIEIEGICGDDQSYSDCYECTHLHLPEEYDFCILIFYKTEKENISRCVPMTKNDYYNNLDIFKENKIKEFEEKYGPNVGGFGFAFCGTQPCVDEARTSEECKNLGIIRGYHCCFKEWKDEFKGKIFEGSVCMNLKPSEYNDLNEYKKKEKERIEKDGTKLLKLDVDCFKSSDSTNNCKYLKIYSLMSILLFL